MGKSRGGPLKVEPLPQCQGKGQLQGKGQVQQRCRRNFLRSVRSGNSSKSPRESEADNLSAEGNGNDSKSLTGKTRNGAVEVSGGLAGKRKGRNGLNGLVQVSGGLTSGKRKGRNGLNGVCENNGGGVALPNGKRSHHDDSLAAGLRESEDYGTAPRALVVAQEQDQRQVVNMEGESLQEEYPYVPGLDDDLALLCLARVPRSDHERFRMVNRKFCTLTRSGDLFKIRRRNGIVEQWVYMVASGQVEWQAFDPKSRKWRRLPPFEADYCYYSSDKESFSVGTQLLVVGRNALEGLVIWRYDLVTNQWAKGTMMHTPRCLYAWASCGSFAYVAGGITLTGEVLQSAERYDPDSERWESLPDLHESRKLCAGCYMDGKFYVIGGENQSGDLTSGEVYDPVSKTWTLIPNMLPRGTSRSFPGAPPLIAVVKNELYALEAESNQLKVYVKATNSWKVLGEAPVRADLASGWGIAFKALGEQLLVIGGARTADREDGMYVCRPDLEGGQLRWDFVTRLCPFGPFVFNCAIMSA